MFKFSSEGVDYAFENAQSKKGGLSSREAEIRLKKNGKNELKKSKKPGAILLFFKQFKDLMVVILLAAAIISALSHGIIDSIIIFAVVILNAVLGVAQEIKAERSIEALQKLTAQKVKVKRDGQTKIINADEIVVGDEVIIEAGDNVAADLRLIEVYSLKIDESMLTGESVAVEKTSDKIESPNSASDCKNIAFSGSTVVYGRAIGIVIATGMNSQIGHLAQIINTTKEGETPLEKQLNKLGKTLSIIILGICCFIFLFNIFRFIVTTGSIFGFDFSGKFLLAVSLAVAAIPEALTAVVTLTMTIGVVTLSRRKAIVRKLHSIETLGCAQIICSDKTGTLTQNKMSVVEHETFGNTRLEREMLFCCCCLCNNSDLTGEKIKGDPTETALINFASSGKFDLAKCIAKNKRIGEVPFDSLRKVMSVLIKDDKEETRVFSKGAVEVILKKCDFVLDNGKIKELTNQIKTKILNSASRMSALALRVIAFAFKNVSANALTDNDETGLIFIGICGLADPVRPEVKQAVATCKTAGITPIMITGDHQVTAIAIARQIKIFEDGDEAITGEELDKLSDADFAKRLNNIKVYARVSPQNKVQIVKAWREKQKIVAMTGDGVNDAPAIKTADIGIGMGISGTDVTKNVADIVLADDNFASIVVAAMQGRKIYDNIRKTVQFLLSSNVCEVLTIFVATMFGFTILLPSHILYVNLVTDTIPAIGIGVEKAEPDIMMRPPRNPHLSIFAGGVDVSIFYQSLILTGLVFATFFIGRATGGESTGITCAFVTLSLSQIFHSFNMRSSNRPVLQKGFFDNAILTIGSLATVVLTLVLIYTPALNKVFKLTPLSPFNLIMVFAFSFLIIPIIDLVKIIKGTIRKKNKKNKNIKRHTKKFAKQYINLR